MAFLLFADTLSATIQPMKRIVLSAILLFAMPLAAQTAAKPTQVAPKPPATPPVISDVLKAQFFKAQAFKMQADMQAGKMSDIFQTAVSEMRKVCGDAFTLQTDQNGDPVCVANPARPTK